MNQRTDQGFKVEPYRFLSNMTYCKVYYDGMLYNSVESAFQASKTLDKEERKQFLNCNPYESKKLGKKVTLRPDWNEVKLDIMEQLLEQKFSSLNPQLRAKLIATKDIELVEVNNWRDFYWGVCNGIGENHLGKLLMKIRSDITPF